MQRSEQYKNSLYAGIIGDALGVPVEYIPRQELALCSVKNMLGYGRYDQPVGTWSDDTSMALCTMESLSRGYDIEDLGHTFCTWLFESSWTPTGFVFDAGLTTFMSLDKIYTEKKHARESGCSTEDDNGNGSLMRILPAALYFSGEKIADYLQNIHDISAITHAHPRAKMGCGIYALLVRALLESNDKMAAYQRMIDETRYYYDGFPEFAKEMPHFSRILSGSIHALPENVIGSSGYIVDTLEASIWCFLNNSDSKSILLAAVNLGLDTDTTGMVAGGLAGLHCGLKGIPQDWIDPLARKSEVDALIDSFVNFAAGFYSRKK